MPKLGWRWLLGLSAVPLLIFAAFCIWLPESARFNLTRNRADLALKTIQRIAIDNKTSLPPGNLVTLKVSWIKLKFFLFLYFELIFFLKV